MALREVLQFPDPHLRRVCESVTGVTDVLRQLAWDMCEVLYHELGIGLAAPQLGEEVRLIVVDTEWNEQGAERNPLILFNPEVTWKEGKPPQAQHVRQKTEETATRRARGRCQEGPWKGTLSARGLRIVFLEIVKFAVSTREGLTAGWFDARP